MLRHEEEVFEEMYDRFPDEYSQVGGIPTIKATYLYKGVASFLHEPHYVLRFMVMVQRASRICCVLKSTFTGGGHQAEAAVLLLQQEHLHESEEADQTRQGRVSYDLFKQLSRLDLHTRQLLHKHLPNSFINIKDYGLCYLLACHVSLNIH